MCLIGANALYAQRGLMVPNRERNPLVFANDAACTRRYIGSRCWSEVDLIEF